jgi:hypothetical protein
MLTHCEKALFNAVQNNDLASFVNIYENSQSVNKFACDKDGVSLLGKAIEKNAVSIASYLFNDKELTAYIDKQGKPPVAYFARNFNKELMTLAKQAGLDFNQEISGNRNILHIIARTEDIDIFNMLIEYGADPFKKCVSGETPFETARRYSNKKINNSEFSL